MLVTGVDPLVPVGETLALSCPEGHIFEDEWYRVPRLEYTCGTDGVFNHEPTAKCVSSEFHRANDNFLQVLKQYCTFQSVGSLAGGSQIPWTTVAAAS